MYLQTAFLLALFYCGVFVLYRLFFHPLHKYPGPILAALTEGYEAYYNIIKGGGWVIEIERLHRLYGPVVRVGPNTLHFNYRQAYHDIYTFGSTLAKDPGFYLTAIGHGRQTSLTFCDPQEAKERRALVAPAFSRRAVATLEYTIQQKIDKLLALLEKDYHSPDSSVKMYAAYRSLTVDIITSYCFAECPDTLDAPDFAHPLVQNAEKTFRVWWLQRLFPFLPSLIRHSPPNLVLWLFPQFKGQQGIKSVLKQQINRILDSDSLSSVEHSDSVYHHLLKPKKRPSTSSLLAEVFILFSAGSDTIANTTYVGTFYALKNKHIRRKLLKELSEAWPNKEGPMSYVALEQLPYLTAFIKESLRFAIGVLHPTPRITNSTTPEIGGLKLPPGTVVEMSTFFMHMNPDIFTDPHTFNPDRWLAEDTTEMMHDLVPFSKGPRICLGTNLAWCELYLIFGNLFRKLDLTLHVSEDTIDDFNLENLKDYFVPQWRKGYRVFAQQLPS